MQIRQSARGCSPRAMRLWGFESLLPYMSKKAIKKSEAAGSKRRKIELARKARKVKAWRR